LVCHPVAAVHIYTQTIHRTIQNNQYTEQHNNWRVRAVPVLASYTLTFALQPRKKHRKTSVNIVHVALPFVRNLGQVSSLSRRNSYICSYTKLYPIITKLIVVFMSRPENLPIELDYNAGDCHNKTNHIIKSVLLYFCSFCLYVNSEKLYKLLTLSFGFLNFTSFLIDFTFWWFIISCGIVKEMHGSVAIIYKLHSIVNIMQVTVVNLAMAYPTEWDLLQFSISEYWRHYSDKVVEKMWGFIFSVIYSYYIK
jgi:hypothetical protein